MGVELCCGSLRSWEQRLLALSGFLVWLWTALSASTLFPSRDFCLGSPRKLLQMYFRSKFWVLYWTKWDLKHCLQEKWALHWTDKLQKHKTVCRFKASWLVCNWENQFSCSVFLSGLCSRSRISPYTNTGSWLKVLQCYSTKFLLLWHSLLDWSDWLAITL